MDGIGKVAEELRLQARKIEEPDSYFQGYTADAMSGDPNNIIMLYRWSGQRIRERASQLYHRRYVLTLNLATDGVACINDQMVNLNVGHALLIFPYQFHYYMVDQDTFNWLVITFDAAGSLPLELMNRAVKVPKVAYILAARMVEVYLGLQHRKSDLEMTQLKHYLNCLLLELILTASKVPREDEIIRNRKARLIEQVNGYIHRHIDKSDLSLEEIAAKHGISSGYLCAVFKDMVGCGPGEYIRSARINRAVNLLNSRSYLIAEVAHMTGFSSPAVFSRCFRRVTGMSPREYARSKDA